MNKTALLLLALLSPAGAQEIAPVRYSVSSAGLSVFAAASLPSLKLIRPVGALSLQAVPQLSAPRLSVSAIPGPALVSPRQAPPALESANRLGLGIKNGGFSSVQVQVFDNGAKPLPVFSAPSDPSPKVPAGVRSVSVRTVRTGEDVPRFIPAGQNSDELIAELRGKAGRMAPYDIRVYEDGQGSRFTGIDVSGRPDLVDQVPELHPHEAALIKKIMARNPDVQILVREDGKTPDLVVGGNIVELKSFIYPHEDYDSSMGTILLGKANEQVMEHGRRHGYQGGYVAVDLALHGSMPSDIPQFIERWLKAKKLPVVVNKIFVFAGGEMLAFERQPDGTFKPADPTFAARWAAFWGFSLS